MLKLLEFLFFGFYTAAAIKTMKQLSIIVLLFSTGILFESVLGISQYFNQSSIGGTFYYFGERAFNSQTPGIANASLNGALILRPYGTFSHPNVLAAYLTIAMIMVISNFKRFFFGIVLLTGSSALFLTMSRVAIVFWLLILGYFLIPQILTIFKRKKIIGLFVVLVFICSIGIYFSFSPIKYRFLTLSLADESIVKRQELISQSIIMIKNNPIFGVGINNFLFNLKGYYLQPVHNIYLLIAAQTGLVGLAFFGWFLMKTFSQFSIFNFQFSIKQKKINFKILNIKNSFKISNFKFQILSLILVLGLFDHYFLTLQQGQLMFAFVFGLCWAKIEG
ncbi:MAG: O-antigen ligase family protein [Candidatus Levybacteria bacterium]|nr:O-antigen ligase family protein [Candidatus Levybacteria bacterium]